MNLTLIIPALSGGAGGAERTLTYKANYWVNKGLEITLLTYDDGSTPPFYDLDSRVRHVPLGIAGKSPNLIAKLYSNLKRIAVLRTAIRNSKPDAVITIGERSSVITLLATRGLKVPVVVSTQTDPASYSIGRVWGQLRLWTYPWADQVIAHTERTLASYPPKVQSRASVIPNPVEVPPTGNASVDTRLKKPSLIAMGRLVPQKGFDLLLRAFAQLKDRHPDWSLTILGEGPLRTELESLRDELGLANRVFLPGLQKNPHRILEQADLFVMSSRFEGFGNALCEAMACGLPVISTDCRSGPREIIRDGVDGVLVPPEDVDSLAAAMGRLMSDEPERKRLASRAVEVTERFGLEKVMRMWEEVLNNVTGKRSL